jgi:hypothetical protein
MSRLFTMCLSCRTLVKREFFEHVVWELLRHTYILTLCFFLGIPSNIGYSICIKLHECLILIKIVFVFVSSGLDSNWMMLRLNPRLKGELAVNGIRERNLIHDMKL